MEKPFVAKGVYSKLIYAEGESKEEVHRKLIEEYHYRGWASNPKDRIIYIEPLKIVRER